MYKVIPSTISFLSMDDLTLVYKSHPTLRDELDNPQILRLLAIRSGLLKIYSSFPALLRDYDCEYGTLRSLQYLTSYEVLLAASKHGNYESVTQALLQGTNRIFPAMVQAARYGQLETLKISK